eukprot:318323_1
MAATAAWWATRIGAAVVIGFFFAKPLYSKQHPPLKVAKQDLDDPKKLEQKIAEHVKKMVKNAKEWKKKNSIQKDDHLIVFLHGYNNSSKDVHDRLDFIDMKIGTEKVVTVAFDWESVNKWFEYDKDKETALKCVPYFIKFIQQIKENRTKGQFTHIDIVAHSMGSLILIEAMKQLLKHQNSEFNPLKGSCIATFAADVDSEEYYETAKEILKDSWVENWFHYYNPYDGALYASSKYNWGKRAGSKEYSVSNKFHSIAIKWTTISHSYIDVEQCCNDLTTKLLQNYRGQCKSKL